MYGHSWCVFPNNANNYILANIQNDNQLNLLHESFH